MHEAMALDDPGLYFNRELSLLAFNRRVLEQALDPATPLLERVRFLTICSTNLDEFFEVRVASHRERAAFGAPQPGPDGRTSQATLKAISMEAHKLVDDQYKVLNDVLLPALEKEGIRLVRRTDWTEEERRWIHGYFRAEVQPILAPMGLDPAHPFPKILNKSLNFVVLVEGQDAFGRGSGIAIVQVPRVLPRVIQFPPEIGGRRDDYVMLSSVIHEHVEELFPGMTTAGCYQFRVTRDGDLWVDEEEVDDLLKALEGELPERKYAEAVRLEVTRRIPDSVASFLLEMFELEPDDLYRAHGPVNLHRLAALHELVDRPDLKYPSFVPRLEPAERGDALFEVVRKADVLLHHPYDSFLPVLELLRAAAADPNVLAIQQTLYRVGSDSPLVDALLDAARAGKEVTVVVELRARFDEAENIDLANRLQEVGAKVVYGIVGFKTHAKMLLIVRREDRELRRYVHLSTGNYHTDTARVYTDLGLLTANPRIAEDVHKVFLQLTGLGKVSEMNCVLQSPFNLQTRLIQLIDAEADNARAGKPARIVGKMNALTRPTVIQALYRASQAGVSIDLVVRGACCLRPAVPGVSDNIRVRSIVGRFLEHSRVFYFYAAGEELTYCSSADWMTRNLVRRVETCFPILVPELKSRVITEALDQSLADELQAWELRPDGMYLRVEPKSESPRSAQGSLMDQVSSEHAQADLEAAQRFGFDLEVGQGERIGDEPLRRKPKGKNGSFAENGRRRKKERAAAAAKKDGKSKKDH